MVAGTKASGHSDTTMRTVSTGRKVIRSYVAVCLFGFDVTVSRNLNLAKSTAK